VKAADVFMHPRCPHPEPSRYLKKEQSDAGFNDSEVDVGLWFDK
jgi:hypothetical protein